MATQTAKRRRENGREFRHQMKVIANYLSRTFRRTSSRPPTELDVNLSPTVLPTSTDLGPTPGPTTPTTSKRSSKLIWIFIIFLECIRNPEENDKTVCQTQNILTLSTHVDGRASQREAEQGDQRRGGAPGVPPDEPCPEVANRHSNACPVHRQGHATFARGH